MSHVLDRQIVFFGGKGGVGKTTLAASFALLAAERGYTTLLVSTDPAHSTSDILETQLGSEPRSVVERLWAVEIDPAKEADRYIADVKRWIADVTPPRLVAEVERQIDIARVTPGAEEAALFEGFTRIIEQAGVRYDRILFDTAPLGPTLRLLSLPELMAAWMEALVSRRKKVNVLARMWRTVAGRAAGEPAAADDPVVAALEQRMARFRRARTVLSDPARTAFVFVVIPERLPVMETEKAVAVLERYGIPVGAVIVNRVLPDAAGDTFVARRRVQEAECLRLIAERFGRHPLIRVPLFESDVVGIAALRRVIGELAELRIADFGLRIGGP